MATPRIQGYTSQKNYDYYQEAYTAYMAKEKKVIPSGTFIIEAIKEYCDNHGIQTILEPDIEK